MSGKSKRKRIVFVLAICVLLPLWMLPVGSMVALYAFDTHHITPTKSEEKQQNAKNHSATNYWQATNTNAPLLPDLASRLCPHFFLNAEYFSFYIANTFIASRRCTNLFVQVYRRVLFLTLIMANAP